MKNKCIFEQYNNAIEIIKKNKELMDILNYISKLNMQNYYIAAGSVFQTIWNFYDGKDLNYNIKDIDVIYFNGSDISVSKDLEYYDLINKYCKEKGYDFEIDVSNEARMHLWEKEKFNIDIEAYKSSEDAIDKWIATVHSIGITIDNNELKIYAPYGLSDIYSKTIRPIKHKYNTKDIYEKKVSNWKTRFDNLNIIEW